MQVRVLRIIAVVVLGTALGLVSSVAPAGAHTDLIQGSPGPSQRVGGDVDFIDLVFGAAVTEVVVELRRPDGSMADGEMVVADGQIIRHEMEALPEPGRYLVEYQMISDDGDFTLGNYFFDYDETAVAPSRLGLVDVPEEPLVTARNAVGAGAVTALLVACGVLLLRLRRSRAVLAARREQTAS
ncbi:MAG: copper resistance CopC family protein [Acidimicrobiales bacterium]